ncbi:MAG: hypothetical protein AB1599_07720 [Planctomycetota bacterium]
MSETINVQEIFKIKPRVGPDSSREDLMLHTLNCHAIIIALYSFTAEKNLTVELMDWLKKHLKMAETLSDTDYGIVGFDNQN